ncbi:MerR family transcriptional regulator [Massilia forsythiae]|uniref:MerR family transcriptional regulator n=1 Tax=Massilia forsythiae TaxID=2728020 RepID=A0A7Z2VUI0_9BURK|nr:MerR family transcriptional regulator [Massilia forsythiae]QJD99211.1 MerR family transcriptional regulator [Massilia forsythiae]
MLKVGELAAAAGLTVRTLHHYDGIGLLRPSARSDAGYRLYDRDDVARLHRIQALRAFGMGLADIGLYLDSPAGAPLAVVERQLAALDRQIAEAQHMRKQLLRLRSDLAAGAQPDLSTWLDALERMSMYEKYFTQEELARLPLYHDEAVKAQWQGLVEEASRLIGAQVAPDSDEAKAFGQRWLEAFGRGTGGDADFAARINLMAAREQEKAGVAPEVMRYMMAVIGELKYAIWSRYLDPEVIARMRRHYAARGHEWTALIERVRAQMRLDPDAVQSASRALGQQWMDLFHDMVGTDPQAVAGFRRAIAEEPMLRKGSGISDEAVAWLRKGMQA